jgi:hypothetical protein
MDDTCVRGVSGEKFARVATASVPVLERSVSGEPLRRFVRKAAPGGALINSPFGESDVCGGYTGGVSMDVEGDDKPDPRGNGVLVFEDAVIEHGPAFALGVERFTEAHLDLFRDSASAAMVEERIERLRGVRLQREAELLRERERASGERSDAPTPPSGGDPFAESDAPVTQSEDTPIFESEAELASTQSEHAAEHTSDSGASGHRRGC